jgi:hypothetical protein
MGVGRLQPEKDSTVPSGLVDRLDIFIGTINVCLGRKPGTFTPLGTCKGPLCRWLLR